MARKRKPVALRPIEPTTTLAKELQVIINTMIKSWLESLTDSIVPASQVSKQRLSAQSDHDLLVTDDAGLNVKVAISIAKAKADTVVEGLRSRVRVWTERVEQWHRKIFTSTVDQKVGVDISHQISGGDLADELSIAVERNVGLIQGLSDDIGKRVEQSVYQSITQNEPVKDLMQTLQDEMQIGANRAEFIARDQTIKLNSDLNRLRQTQAGIEEYIWVHSGAAHPRPEHVERDGEIFSWDDPPEDGPPGTLPNCGCTAQAYLRLPSDGDHETDGGDGGEE